MTNIAEVESDAAELISDDSKQKNKQNNKQQILLKIGK